MAINPNSREAYELIREALTKRQGAVFEYLATFGPLSIKGIALGMGLPDNEISPRIGELKKMDPPVIACVGRTKNPGGGKTADYWTATPVFVKRLTEAQKAPKKGTQMTLIPKDHLRSNYHDL